MTEAAGLRVRWVDIHEKWVPEQQRKYTHFKDGGSTEEQRKQNQELMNEEIDGRCTSTLLSSIFAT